MANVKTPDGGFYLDNTQFDVDYEENLVTFIGETGEGAITADGGIFNANAILTGTDELTIEVPDAGESATVGITPESVTLVHNTNSDADARIRVVATGVEITGGDTTIQINGTGVNFGGGALSNISSIGSVASGTPIAFEETLDMNSHTITGLPTIAVSDATNETDVITQLNALLAQLRAAGIIPNT